MNRLLCLMLLAVMLGSIPLAARAAEARAPRVVVSIKPLHSLVAGVMQGVGEPELLVRTGGSPHGYTLKPSEARLLSEAQLIVWVGAGLEGFLVKPLATLGRRAEQLELARVLAADLLPQRRGGSWDRHADDDHDHDHDHGGAGGYDPHLWLDPLLAKQIVRQSAAALSRLDPRHRQAYGENAEGLLQQLDALDAELKAELAPVRQRPYVVFHDAYQYFETAYGLNAVGSVTLDPERTPSARRIAEIREKIAQLKVRCVFSEPQFEPRLVATVIEGSRVRTGVLDPIGAALPVGPGSYFQLLRQLAAQLRAGLE